ALACTPWRNRYSTASWPSRTTINSTGRALSFRARCVILTSAGLSSTSKMACVGLRSAPSGITGVGPCQRNDVLNQNRQKVAARKASWRKGPERRAGLGAEQAIDLFRHGSEQDHYLFQSGRGE